jgi:hypothetical protein
MTESEVRQRMRELVAELANLMLSLETPELTYLANVTGGEFDGQTIGVAIVMANPEDERGDELS